jgi:magnesium transporter
LPARRRAGLLSLSTESEQGMITVWKSAKDNGMLTVDASAPDTWVYVTAPEAEEKLRLQQEFGVPEAFLAAALDADELARTDKENDVTLIILLVPHALGSDDETPYDIVPLGIILTPERLITVSRVPLPFLENRNHRHWRPVSTAKRYRLILQLLSINAQAYLAYLRQIDAVLSQLQRKLQRSLKNKELLDMLRYQKSLTYFRTGLQSNEIMMRRLLKMGFFDTWPEDRDLLEDVLVENAQAREMAQISADILSQMADAFASIISNNVNDVMKILAVATIILSIPTVIASFYGMNVALPGQNLPLTYAVLLAAAVVLCGTVAFLAWRRDWL